MYTGACISGASASQRCGFASQWTMTLRHVAEGVSDKSQSLYCYETLIL